MKPSLSLIIITKNGEATIEQCLQSVSGLATEIIVFDSGSTDNTVSICKKYTDKVFETDWPGYGTQKCRAIAKATGDWVLSLDDDEWLSEGLKEEIKTTLQNPAGKVYRFPMRTKYCDQWVRFGDVGRKQAIRLFKRNAATFQDGAIHEGLLTDEKIHDLKSPVYHHSYLSYEALMERMNSYTTLTAQSRFNKGKRTRFSSALFGATWAFLRAYIFRLGFLDGQIGFVVAFSSAESSFYRHMKLLALQRKAVNNH